MIDFKKELEKFKPCMNTDEVEEAIYGSDLKDLTDIMREVIEEFRENEKMNEKELAVKIKEEIKEELEEKKTEISTNTFLISGKPIETSEEEKKEKASSDDSTKEQEEKKDNNSEEKIKQPTEIENTNKNEEDKGGTK